MKIVQIAVTSTWTLRPDPDGVLRGEAKPVL